MRRVGALLTVAVFIGTLSFAAVATAQKDVVEVEGRVEWIAAGKMVVAPYTAVGAINVDLTQVDQLEYQRLVTGDSVVVTGTVSSEGDRVIATSVHRLAS
jgi:hydrogenase maturation factor